MKSLILVLTLFAFPTISRAEMIGVVPDSWDFGDVQVGDSITRQFLISSLDEFTPLTIDSITIVSDPFSAFSITAIDPIPLEFHFDDPPIALSITFTPPSVGEFAAILQIDSNDIHNFPPDGLVEVPLTGRASEVPEPSSLVLGLTGCAFGLLRRRRRGSQRSSVYGRI